MSKESAAWHFMNKEGAVRNLSVAAPAAYPVIADPTIINPGADSKVVVHGFTISPSAAVGTVSVDIGFFATVGSGIPATLIADDFGVGTAVRPLDLNFSNAPIAGGLGQVLKMKYNGTGAVYVVLQYNIVPGV